MHPPAQTDNKDPLNRTGISGFLTSNQYHTGQEQLERASQLHMLR